MKWPLGVRVGHTGMKSETPGLVTLHAVNVNLTPEEARTIAKELILRADFQERAEDTHLENEIPRWRVNPG